MIKIKTAWVPVYAQVDLKNMVATLMDGTPTTPNSLGIVIGEGNLTWTESRNVEYKLDRGKLKNVRLGDEIPVDVSLDAIWDFLTYTTATGGAVTVSDFLKKRNNAAGYISTDSDVCNLYAVDIKLVNTPPCGGVPTEVIMLADFRWDSIVTDPKAGTLAITGKCNITMAGVTRV